MTFEADGIIGVVVVAGIIRLEPARGYGANQKSPGNRYRSRVARHRSTRLAVLCAFSPVVVAASSQVQSPTATQRAVPARIEKIADGVSATTIHGWNTCRLVRRGGVLFASAAVSNPKATDYWDH